MTGFGVFDVRCDLSARFFPHGGAGRRPRRERLRPQQRRRSPERRLWRGGRPRQRAGIRRERRRSRVLRTDSTELTSTGQATLDKQATWLNQYARYTFTIEGHADERGTREYNFALGARRAETTKNYLIAKGVSAARIKTISYGKERPVAVCNDISCWSQNRRAVTVLAGAVGS